MVVLLYFCLYCMEVQQFLKGGLQLPAYASLSLLEGFAMLALSPLPKQLGVLEEDCTVQYWRVVQLGVLRRVLEGPNRCNW